MEAEAGYASVRSALNNAIHLLGSIERINPKQERNLEEVEVYLSNAWSALGRAQANETLPERPK